MTTTHPHATERGVAIDRIAASAYTVPTDRPESDGTLVWQATTMVLVEAEAGGETGIGYSYTHHAAAVLIAEQLAHVVRGLDALDVPAAWAAMVRAIRNLGRPGIASSAIAAVDIALWDLKARLLDLPLVALLGAVREAVPVYGSGGFTSYTIAELQAQLGAWVDAGIPRVKMKVGTRPEADLARVRAARIGGCASRSPSRPRGSSASRRRRCACPVILACGSTPRSAPSSVRATGAGGAPRGSPGCAPSERRRRAGARPASRG